MFSKLVRFEDLSSSVLDRWKELISASACYESPFFDPEFTRIVSAYRGDIRVLLHGRSDQIELIWPLQYSGRYADPVGAPFCDYHGPILSPEWVGNINDVISSAGIGAVNYSFLVDSRNVFRSTASEKDGSFVCGLKDGADLFFELQKTAFPKHAKKMRRMSRKFEREVGEVSFQFDDRDPDTFAKVISWKRRQYAETGRHDVLTPEWVRSMLQELWVRTDVPYRAYLHTLKSNGRLIAAELNLANDCNIHGWIPVFDPKFSNYSPGFLLVDRLLQEASERGFSSYDLGVSAGYYKKYYATYQIPVYGGTIGSKALLSRLGRAGDTAWRQFEDANIPKVSALAGKMRRRYDMIRTVETTFKGKVSGVLNAAQHVSNSTTGRGRTSDPSE